MISSVDTIAAIATPPGRGGVGIIRLSGPHVKNIAMQLLNQLPEPRHAYYTNFLDSESQILDQGIALYFKAPHSFTGEDVLELQGHGGPVVMNHLLAHILSLGVRLARPGEFSERAFLNDKLDLTQAEAIADLINASSLQAARNALNSLQGAFSKQIHEIVKSLIHLRVYIEATLDFPEEEIDFLADHKVIEQLDALLIALNMLLASAEQGRLVQEGIRVVIAGRPNAGKSSLLNQLTEQDSAIVTDIPGTTRDVLREQIQLDGMPLHIIDTAGLRVTSDLIEQEGIKRAMAEITKADLILKIYDSRDLLSPPESTLPLLELPDTIPTLVLYNKIDLLNEAEQQTLKKSLEHSLSSHTSPLFLSAKTGTGLDNLKQAIKKIIGLTQSTEGQFVARERHLNALNRARAFVQQGQAQLAHHQAAELLAEDLLKAQQSLNEITGEFTSDDLLGEIFSNFCIGK